MHTGTITEKKRAEKNKTPKSIRRREPHLKHKRKRHNLKGHKKRNGNVIVIKVRELQASRLRR